jgi:uncharacterized protein YjlB
MSTISKLKNIKDVDPITDNLEGWKVTEGSPIMKTWILHTNNDESYDFWILGSYPWYLSCNIQRI